VSATIPIQPFAHLIARKENSNEQNILGCPFSQHHRCRVRRCPARHPVSFHDAPRGRNQRRQQHDGRPGRWSSFTMAQAQKRFEDQGYTQVSALAKDDKSIWRGHAMKDGKAVNVALDYQGNITAN
jgi:hypothetical protein